MSKAKYDCACSKCLRKIEQGELVSYQSNKYKIAGEEICQECVDYKIYRESTEKEKGARRKHTS